MGKTFLYLKPHGNDPHMHRNWLDGRTYIPVHRNITKLSTFFLHVVILNKAKKIFFFFFKESSKLKFVGLSVSLPLLTLPVYGGS